MKKSLICLFAIFLSGCGSVEARFTPQTSTALPNATVMSTGESDLAAYAFPVSIDPSKKYLFYLHGKIIEEQGIHAVSPDYGEYEYAAILNKLAGYGFIVISEQRENNAEVTKYAARIKGQVAELLDAGVSSKNITVIGASKGAYIAAAASDLLKNPQINFVLLGTCHPDTIKEWRQSQITLYGNILAIRDSVDEYAGSCDEMFAASPGIGRHEEIVLHIGTGHGILYKPLDEWIIPAIQWARR
jgi:hypothetical protein